MAQSDVTSLNGQNVPAPKTAGDNIANLGPEWVDTDAAARAAAAGVKRASFINYDVALDAYAARSDVESLARKNARNQPADFKDASFMRTVSGNTGSGSAA